MHLKIDGALDLMKYANGFLNTFPASRISLFPLCLITPQ